MVNQTILFDCIKFFFISNRGIHLRICSTEFLLLTSYFKRYLTYCRQRTEYVWSSICLHRLLRVTTVLCHTVMFQSMRTTYSKGIPEYYDGVDFPVRIHGSGGILLFFFWQEQYLWGVAIDALSLTTPQFWEHRLCLSQSASELSQHTHRSPHHPPFSPHSVYTRRGRFSLMVFRVHRSKFLDEDSISCTKTWSSGATLTHIKGHCRFRES